MRTVHRLELDLDVFAGPFDLLLTLILREELDLLEVDLADVVLAYLDHLEARDELDLEAATEFLVLIAALLELKSRLMLPRRGGRGARRARARRGGRGAARADARSTRASAAPPAGCASACAASRGAAVPLARRCRGELRRLSVEQAEACLRARPCSARRSAACCARRRRSTSRHMATPRVIAGRAPRAPARAAAARRASRFDEAVEGADRVTVAVTLFALLELYKRGEASWEQAEPFGPITVSARR